MSTVPVDLVDVNDCLLRSLAAAGGEGAFAIDDDGAAAGRVVAGRCPAAKPFRSRSVANEIAVHALQARIGMAGVRFARFRFGNLNTPGDLTRPASKRPAR